MTCSPLVSEPITFPFSDAQILEQQQESLPTAGAAFHALMRDRRSIRRLAPGPFPDESRQRLLDAVRLTPAAYNLPPWHVDLVHERREELWSEVEAGFRDHLSGDRLERYLDRLHGFRAGVAVALVFVDHRVELALHEEKGASPRTATEFVQQALGMVQLALWLGISAEGLVSSLQHWDDLIGDRMARFCGLSPQDFHLAATMPIGYATEEPRLIARAATAAAFTAAPNGHAPIRE